MKISTAFRKVESFLAIPVGFFARKTFDRRRLSGDSFASLADVSLYKEYWPKPSLFDLKAAQVIFLPSGFAEAFISEYLPFCSPKVLILGDGDRDWNSFPFDELKDLSRVFLQNSSIPNDEKFRCLPIGIENRRYGRNGMPYNFLRFYIRREKRQGVFLGPLGKTHSDRDGIENLRLSSKVNLEVLSERVSSIEFAARSSRWSHVLAPRGNGHDTHRFWETLYRGSVPVVKEDQWSKNISSYGIPMETVEDWTIEEIERVSLKPKTLPQDPFKVPALWQDFWVHQIREAL